ncbi:MAG TPA: peptidoglycan DD-metalloendopeptidase family protein [Methylomirabilota bacterium]|nr:peptidoglycan DD-metalloendopeptidase family protein [Methylomirabilota bacterium]
MKRPLLFTLMMIVAIALPSFAERHEEKIKQNEKALGQVKSRLKEEQAQATAAKKKEASILVELESIERALAAKRKELQQLDRRLRSARAQVDRLENEISRLETQRSGQEGALSQRLRALYKLQAQGGVLPAILNRTDPAAQAVSLRHLTTLASVDVKMIQEYTEASKNLGERKREMEQRRREFEALRAETNKERADVDRDLQRRRILLVKVREDRAYHERMVSELQEASQRLQALLKDLQQSRPKPLAKAPSTPETPSVGFGTLKGRLPWPAEGKIVAAFGQQVHPRFGTRTFKNGVDINADEGSAITAVYTGIIAYAGWFKGYGNLVILDHGNGYFTLYAHIAEIHTQVGESVRQGQVIATVGDTGSLTGPRLYFEVRYQGRPQNPEQWLRHQG